MAINTAGGLQPFPGNVLAEEEQPPPQNPADAHAPALLVPSLASSPLQPLPPADVALPSTEPRLSSNAHDGSSGSRDATAEAFVRTLNRHDYEAAHRLLDQGINLIENYFGRPLLAFVLQSTPDSKIIHRMLALIGPAARREMASSLCDTVIHYNPVGLECLMEWKLVGKEPTEEDLLASLQRAALFKSPPMLEAGVRLWRRHVPHRMPELECLLANIGPHARALRAFSAIGRLDLMENLGAVSDVLLDCIESQREEAAKELIDWLKQSDEFGAHRRLPLKHAFDRLGDDALCLLARAGLPFELHPDAIPLFKNPERAAEFRAAVYGKDLALSTLGQLTASGKVPPEQLFQLIAACRSRGDLQRMPRESPGKYVENALFMSGFAGLVAKELVCLLERSNDYHMRYSNSEKFDFYALMNELQASDALAGSPDPEIHRQLDMVVTAAQEMIESLVGSPQALVADLLRCIRPPGKVDGPTLRARFGHDRGLPITVWQQLHWMLKQWVAAALDSPGEVPVGLTLREAQAALHEQLQVRVFRRLLDEMPRSLQSRKMTVRANEAGLSDEDRIAQHAAIAVLTQYCEQLAQDPDGEIPVIFSLVRHSSGDDSDDSSSGES